MNRRRRRAGNTEKRTRHKAGSRGGGLYQVRNAEKENQASSATAVFKNHRGNKSSYLMVMLFLTELTPLIPRAMSTALSMASFEVTNPLSCTTSLKVSTLTSLDLTTTPSPPSVPWYFPRSRFLPPTAAGLQCGSCPIADWTM